MSEYRRLISYIYEYEGKEKGKNVGFVKLENRNGQCRLNLNIKRIYAGGNATGVYLLGKNREKTFLGNIFVRNGNGEFRIIMDSQNVSGSGNGLDTYYGLTVHDVKNSWRSYTTIWEDAIVPEHENDVNPIGTMAEEILPDSAQIAPPPEFEDAAEAIEKEIEGEIEGEAASPEMTVAHAAEVGVCGECRSGEEQPENSAEEIANRKNPPESEMKSEAEPELKPQPGTKSEAEPGVKSDLVAGPGTETDTPPEPKQGSDSDSALKEQPEPAPECKTGPISEPAPASEMFPQPELEDPDVLRYLRETEDIAADPEKLWQELRKNYPKMQLFDYEGECEILAIRPQDIGRLPRESWIYGNNSFLLHGYYSFRYLILVRLCGENSRPRYLIGVPGHYYSNEKYMASMFGFPNFVLSKKQPPNDGRFGYWYTDIRMR